MRTYRHGNRGVRFEYRDADLDAVQKAMGEGYTLLHRAIEKYLIASKRAQAYFNRVPRNSWTRELIGNIAKVVDHLDDASTYDNEAAHRLRDTKKNAPKFEEER